MIFFNQLPQDWIVVLAYWLSLALLILATVTLIFIFLLRIHLILENKKNKQLKNLWQPILAQSLISLPAELPKIRKKEISYFLNFWNYYQRSLRGEAKNRLNKLILRLNISKIIIKQLHQYNLRKKLRAITALGYLQETNAWKNLLILSHHPASLVSLSAARALMQINTEKATPYFIELLKSRTDWPPSFAATILKESNKQIISDALAKAVLETKTTMLARMVEYLGVVYPETAAPSLKILIEKCDIPEVLASCLKVLHDPTYLEFARKSLCHPSWIVRVQAANFMGRMGNKKDLDALTPLLSDDHWWVRYRAAQAIFDIPGLGKASLEQIKSQSTNEKAQAILAQAIEENV
ncbi:MAG: HEAT repeat domain-containing protein [Deltaproteobacteria bacterium]|nr:HEAT repeat domain-containing protein [Deltaproteobacteria bacterium]